MTTGIGITGLIAVAIASIFVVVPLSADAKSYRWKCSYNKMASPEGVKREERFSLEFAFDDITGKAVMIGNIGVADVDIHMGNLGVTFMEKLGGGAVQTTTVTRGGESIHSRHSIIGSQVVPTQYYGTCAIS